MGGAAEKVLIEEMTWPEIRAAMEAGADTIVIGVGAVEQHGPHLPEGTDACLAECYAIELARRLGRALAAPVIRPGVSPHHMGFPGTITLRESTLVAIMEDYVESFVKHGFTRFQFFCSHGGNYDTVARRVERFRRERPDCVFLPESDLLEHLGEMNAVARADGIPPEAVGAHAGDSETSQMLACRPDSVRMDRAAAGYLGFFDGAAKERLFSGGTRALSEIGVLGDPRGSTAERGRRYVAAGITLLERAALDYRPEKPPSP